MKSILDTPKKACVVSQKAEGPSRRPIFKSAKRTGACATRALFTAAVQVEQKVKGARRRAAKPLPRAPASWYQRPSRAGTAAEPIARPKDTGGKTVSIGGARMGGRAQRAMTLAGTERVTTRSAPTKILPFQKKVALLSGEPESGSG